MCAEVSKNHDNGKGTVIPSMRSLSTLYGFLLFQSKVRMAACNEKNQNQRWTLSPTGQLKHHGSLLCLDSGEGSAGHKCFGLRLDVQQVCLTQLGLE